MVRDVESEKCTALIISGTVQVGGLLPCAGIGRGRCYKDMMKEGRSPDETVAVVSGDCLADEKEGIQDPGDSAGLLQRIQDNPGSIGARIALGRFIERPSE